MSGTIPLDQLGSDAGGDGLRRDRWGRLLVVPPEGGKPEGFTRVTTVAKATDEGGGLMPWKATMAVCGTLRRPGIRAKWEAVIAAHGDPWYASPEAKAACKRLVEEAAEAGGATDRREQGTALHAITAQLDRGEMLHHLSAETQRDLDAYHATLAQYGVEVVPDMIEVTVVLDRYKVGGSFDRLVRVAGHELPMVADLKTGADISYSDGSFSTQIAAYAHGEAIYWQGADPNGSTDERLPMPEVDQHVGMVIWLPAGDARCELFAVDLDAGWEGFDLSMAVRRWRTRKGLRAPFSQWRPTPPAEPGPITVAAEVASLASRGPVVVTAAVSAASLPEPEVEPDLDAEADRAQVRAWLQTRIDTIGRLVDARADLGRWWPVDMPTLRASGEHTADQLDAIEAVLDQVETRHSIPFGPPKPGQDMSYITERRILSKFPNSTIVSKEKA